MWSETRVLSNVWWPIRMNDVSVEKSLAVWLNSSLGLLTILAQRTSTRGGWVAMKKADLEETTRPRPAPSLVLPASAPLRPLRLAVRRGVRAPARNGPLPHAKAPRRRHLRDTRPPRPLHPPRAPRLRAGGVQHPPVRGRLRRFYKAISYVPPEPVVGATLVVARPPLHALCGESARPTQLDNNTGKWQQNATKCHKFTVFRSCGNVAPAPSTQHPAPGPGAILNPPSPDSESA